MSLVFTELVPSDIVTIMGKWSLPCRSGKISQCVHGESCADIRLRSTWVNVLWVEKWVGLPLFRMIKSVLARKFSMILPLLLIMGDPQRGFHELKSPVIRIGVLKVLIILSKSVAEKVWDGWIYMDMFVILVLKVISAAIADICELMSLNLWGMVLCTNKPEPRFALVFKSMLWKQAEYCLGIYGVVFFN